MLPSPSPSLTAANDKVVPHRPAEDAPQQTLLVGALSDRDMEQFEVDQTALLPPPSPPPPPPPSSVIIDPFDDEVGDSPARQSLDLDLITRYNAGAHGFNAPCAAQGGPNSTSSEAIATGLQIRTDLLTSLSPHISDSLESDSCFRHSLSTSSMPKRTSSIRAALYSSASSLSPKSALSSPQLAAMLNITPLPSPLEPSRDHWKITSRTRSRGSSLVNAEGAPPSRASTLSPPSSPPKRKAYTGLQASVGERQSQLSGDTSEKVTSDDGRHRSISDYAPDATMVSKPRNVAVSENLLNQEHISTPSALHREEYLAVQRGFSVPPSAFRSPSTSASTDGSSAASEASNEAPTTKGEAHFCTAQSVASGHSRRYKLIRQLGQGTFSKVFLAIRQVENGDDSIDYTRDSTNLDGVRIRSRRLVAIKAVEQGPAGGADAERVEVSLRRELEILKAINHPSLVHLKAFGTQNKRSLLVLNYCPGGDLFEVASSQSEVLVPSLVRRMFVELVSAVRYLHLKFIVHRDIKLENVLLNIPVQVHSDVPDWRTLDRAVVTLTDLGLSRRIPQPPESSLLTTRCGSEDYAAPELLMGQPYDGRQTDGWALGVMLYALMEGRLPFDPLPGARGDPGKLKARTTHRIARCEWGWYKYGDDNGDWDPQKGKEYEGARSIVEGLLKRSSLRTGLDEIREMPWVKEGIVIDGGLRRVEEEAM